ncbi:cytochrome bb' ubiquinol oxidase subunit II [Candidatus Hydrogenisulfobacillus filiaventi]|uniref:Cytochrome bb' ubiquinol oxidase subunit II n=1 Tax=Candidatus Hydrogenisulfobacillus filiaventi TaxID=2707344 RepID=A0A6F8ZEU3_9FIRM|nr:cytochrome bb' ubiquinol oxidase subunit II [Candidatus Hydrogenisulfobacillus filiaventi]
MTLQALWFILVAVLFMGFFFLEGFDYGVGTLLPFLGKTDNDRRVMLNTIGPVWNVNEVWLITAGGALFAAFPEWYATMFSGFYLALVLMLLGLIARGVGLEYRSKESTAGWRKWWDSLVFGGSALLALLWGVAISDLAHGLAINAQFNYVGGFFGLLSLYSVFGGLTSLVVFALSGALYLRIRTEGAVRDAADKAIPKLGATATVLLGLYLIWTSQQLGGAVMAHWGVLGVTVAALAWLAMLSERFFFNAKKPGWTFAMQGISIALVTAAMFIGLFPDVMISTINLKYSLTINNAASNPYTLGVMTIVALVMVPIVLAYQIWVHWMFRKPVSGQMHLEY